VRMNRRDFLKGAAVVPAAVLRVRLSAVAGTFGSAPAQIRAVMYDERYADCGVFADLLACQGAVAFSTSGDAASLWYGPLRAHLARYGGHIAGLTTDSDFVVSRDCGRELSFRTLYEGAHDGRSPERLTHRLRGDHEHEVRAALLRSDAPWAESLAGALSRLQSSETLLSRSALTETMTVATPRSAHHPGYLTSWLLSSG
jgi:hypothetical protein